MKNKKQKIEEIDDLDTLTPIGKISLLIFFSLIIFFSIYNRINDKNTITKEEIKVNYKNNLEINKIIKELSDKNNYKIDLFITTDYERKEIIISKNDSSESILIKDKDSIQRYYKVNNNYYTIENEPILVDKPDILNNKLFTLVYPDAYVNMRLNKSKDFTEENYKIKRYKINISEIDTNINNNIKPIELDINYEDKLYGMKLNVTDYYNYINNTNYQKVLYEINYSDEGNINLDEIRLYDLQ